MVRVFISFASPDLRLAQELHRWLVDDGHDAFLDRHLDDGILVGEEWQKRLHERLRWADAVVCVITSAYTRSPWCNAELGIAQSRGNRVLPVRAEPGVNHPLLGSIQYMDLTEDVGPAQAKLAAALQREDIAGGHGWPDDRSPFPGLRPLDTDEHSVFFGRSHEVEQLAESLRSPAERVQRAVSLVVGPSGCGKSSLVRAGLLPLMASDQDWWTLPAIRPGTEPLAALARELAASACHLRLGWTATDVRRFLDHGDLTGLADDLLLAVPGQRRRRHLLIVVDQFEELLTQTGSVERTRFAELLHRALAGQVQIVATMRPEFLDELLASPELAVLPTRTYTLRPLRLEALRAVIEGPADRAGIGIDEDLVNQLVADTGDGEALPLLAYTLAQLTANLTRGDRISIKHYKLLGEVHGVLSAQAEAALDEAVIAGGRDRERAIRELLRLVTVDEQGRPTRWRIRRDDLTAQVLTELQPFLERRLLISDTANGSVVLGVAHEAFLSAWPPLREAITSEQAALRARRRVEQAANEWAENGRARGRLWERGQLAAALADTGAGPQPARKQHEGAPLGERSVASKPGYGRLSHRWTVVADRVDLSPRARDFLRDSIRRDRRRRRRTSTILSVLLAVAAAAALVAGAQQREAANQRQQAEEGQRIATARLLLAQAENILSQDPHTALQLNEAAASLHPSPETNSALVSNLLTTSYVGPLDTGEGDGGPVIAFAPNEPLLAAAGTDGVQLWDLANPESPRALGSAIPNTSEDGAPLAVTFTPGGDTLAIADSNGPVALWNVSDPRGPVQLGTPLPDQGERVSAIAFATNKPLLATVDSNSTVLWDIADPAEPRRLAPPLTDDNGGVASAAFAPGGKVLAVAGGASGDSVVLWDLSDPASPSRLPDLPTDSRAGANGVAFSPDGNTLAVGGSSGAISLWNLTDPAEPVRIQTPVSGHSDDVYEVNFASERPLLATASVDGTVLLWDLTDPTAPLQPPRLIAAGNSPIYALTLAPTGDILATGTNSSSLQLWDTTNPVGVIELPTSLSSEDGGSLVAFSPDGQTLATADGYSQGTVGLWDLTDPTAPVQLPPLAGPEWLTAMAYSPRQPYLATGRVDGTVQLWDLTEPASPTQLSSPLTGHDSLSSIAFSPNQPLLAVGGGDGTVLWDLSNPASPVRLTAPLTGRDGAVSALAFSPDGEILASAYTGDTAVVWDITDPATPTELATLSTGLSGGVYEMAFATGSPSLITPAPDGALLLWDLTEPSSPTRHRSALAVGKGGVSAMAFAPDQPLLAIAERYGVLQLWDFTAPRSPAAIDIPVTDVNGTVLSLAFAPERPLLALATLNPAVGGQSVLLLNLEDLQSLRTSAKDQACAITNTGLDREEWSRYVPDLDYVDTCTS